MCTGLQQFSFLCELIKDAPYLILYKQAMVWMINNGKERDRQLKHILNVRGPESTDAVSIVEAMLRGRICQ